jgi:hypothetical protein
MQIDFRAEHREKTLSPKLDSLLSLSNVTLEREVQPLKHSLEMVSTDDGTQIDFSAEHSRNACSAKRVRVMPASNMTI